MLTEGFQGWILEPPPRGGTMLASAGESQMPHPRQPSSGEVREGSAGAPPVPDLDLSLIDANLRLTPAERLAQHALALKTAYWLREGMERARAGS